MHVAHLIGSADGASRWTAALGEFNAAYAAGNRALARNAVFSRIPKASRSDGLDVVVKKHGR